MRPILSFSILLFALAGTSASARVATPSLTLDEVRTLARAALTDSQQRLSGVGFEFDPAQSHSRYIYVTATWTGTKKGSVILGNYAVDKITADIWSATASCLEMKNSKLKQLQMHIRQRIHLSRARYQKLRTHGPLCDA
jgi:hypothetical protein